MPTLHALVVGIDHYENVAGRLKYAHADALDFYKYLKDYTADGYRLKAKFLPNEKAKKRDVINAFSHFQGASGADVCLFYFAGHGSEICNPPEELEHLARKTGKLESILCYDSRKAGGTDLSDQEIAHLIGTTVQNISFSGNGHFAVIMDCCHSGHGTRLEKGEKIMESRAVGERSSSGIQDFHGYSKGRTFPVRGNHIQLAACGDQEEAYDGMYTSKLLKRLKAKVAGASYAKIQREVGHDVRNSTDNTQIPEIFSTPSSWQNLPFLGGAVR